MKGNGSLVFKEGNDGDGNKEMEEEEEEEEEEEYNGVNCPRLQTSWIDTFFSATMELEQCTVRRIWR